MRRMTTTTTTTMKMLRRSQITMTDLGLWEVETDLFANDGLKIPYGFVLLDWLCIWLIVSVVDRFLRCVSSSLKIIYLS